MHILRLFIIYDKCKQSEGVISYGNCIHSSKNGLVGEGLL